MLGPLSIAAFLVLFAAFAAACYNYHCYKNYKLNSPFPVLGIIFSFDDGIQSWAMVATLLVKLRETGYSLAIVTSSSRADLEAKLADYTVVTDSVDAIVTINEVSNGKPAADLFMEAARRLRIDATRGPVFDETPAGIEGAQAAGMLTAAVGPAVNARFGLLAPEWLLRDISQFDTREITPAIAGTEVEPPPPSFLTRFLPVNALTVCFDQEKRTTGYGPVGSSTMHACLRT